MKNSQLISDLIKSAIDLHFHIGPEIIPRKYNSVSSLIRKEKGKITGIALKNHFYPTQPLISEVNNNQEMLLIGSVVLNNYQGGLNPEVIYANSIITDNPTIVWLPTINAQQFLASSTYEIPPEWVQKPSFIARKAREISAVSLHEKLEPTLKMIKKTGAILATGHISWSESVKIINKAQTCGINKIILTHPIYQRINCPLSIQQELAASGVKIEHCFSMYAIDEIAIEKIARQIKTIGAENCILSSDVGQVFSPDPSQALKQFTQLLIKTGIKLGEIEQMLIENPRELIEVDL